VTCLTCQLQADADEEEFDEDDEELAEGQYLTAEEKAAILRGFDASDSESDGDVESDAGEDMDVDDVDDSDKVAPVDEERMGVQGLVAAAEEEEAAEEEAESSEDDGESHAGGAEGDRDGLGPETEPQTTSAADRGDEDAEDEEDVKVSRAPRACDSAEVSISASRKFGTSRVNSRPAATTGEAEEQTQEDDLMDLEGDADDAVSSRGRGAVAESAESAEAGGDVDTESVANQTTLTSRTLKSRREKDKKKSTGNTLYRLALEEEERRSRRQKVRNSVFCCQHLDAGRISLCH
jgi:hypothetical protein